MLWELVQCRRQLGSALSGGGGRVSWFRSEGLWVQDLGWGSGFRVYG